MVKTRAPRRAHSYRRSEAESLRNSRTEFDATPAVRASPWAGAAIALLSAVLGVAGSLVAVHNTAASEERRSQTEFLYSQRQTIYLKVVADEASTSGEESRLLTRSTPADLKRYHDSADVLTAEFFEFQTDVGSVLVIGGNSLRPQMQVLVDEHKNYERALGKWLNVKANLGKFREQNGAVEDAKKRLNIARDRFFELAQQDIGNKNGQGHEQWLSWIVNLVLFRAFPLAPLALVSLWGLYVSGAKVLVLALCGLAALVAAVFEVIFRSQRRP